MKPLYTYGGTNETMQDLYKFQMTLNIFIDTNS